jgi:hypothetical protein
MKTERQDAELIMKSLSGVFLETTKCTRKAIVLLGAMLMGGCATPIIVTTCASKPPTVNASAVKVYKIGEQAPQNYEILGVVSAISKWKPVDRGTIKALKAKAAGIGADTLLGYYEELKLIPTGYNSWSSALAVKILPSTQATKTNCPFAVAIPRVNISTNISLTKDKADFIDKWGRATAQLLLTEKGYYAFWADDAIAAPLEDGLRSFGKTTPGNHGVWEPDLVLGIHLSGRKKGVGIGFGGLEGLGPTERNTFEIALFSRSADKVVQGNLGSGRFAEGYILALFVPSLKTAESVQRAVTGALEPLPQFSPPQ